MGGVFIYHNLKGGVPYLLPAIGLAFFISRKGGLTLADDKKNIGPEVEKTETATAPEQPAPEKVEPVVADPAPVEKAAPTEKAEPITPEAPGPAATEPPKPDKEAKQTATPDKGNPAPAPAGKVVDFAAAREEAGKDKPPKEKAPKQKTT